MNAAAFTRLREAFEAALELPPPDRDALLVARLGDAPALLAEARAMLTADATGAGPAGGAATGGAFLEPPGPRTAGAAVTEEAAPLEPGQALADFTLEDARLVSSAGPEVSLFLLYDPRKARLGKVRAMVDFLMGELGEG